MNALLDKSVCIFLGALATKQSSSVTDGGFGSRGICLTSQGAETEVSHVGSQLSLCAHATVKTLQPKIPVSFPGPPWALPHTVAQKVRCPDATGSRWLEVCV